MPVANTKVHVRVSRPEPDFEPLKTIVIFCGIGLLICVLFASFGWDLSVGFL